VESQTISNFSGGVSHCRGLLMRQTISAILRVRLCSVQAIKQRCGIFHFLKDVKLIYEKEFCMDIQILAACSR
jgi:hypothetical protein